MSGFTLRTVRITDAAAIAAIYAPIVENTVISFEEAAPSTDEMRRRIEDISASFPWLVAEQAGRVLGYAYASRHRERAAYRWSVDVSAYVDAAARHRGVASALYSVLFQVLEAQGFHRALAGITMPNDASVGLHRQLGFELIGIYPEVGFKLGAWRDTSWWQRPIGATMPTPREPVDVSRLDPGVLAAIGLSLDSPP